MLAKTLLRQYAEAMNAQLATATEGCLLAPLGKLHFADRAVKTTSQQPQFICLHQLIAAQSSSCSAVVAALDTIYSPNGSNSTEHHGSAGGCGVAVNNKWAPFPVRVQLQGDCAVCVLRGPRAIFQCRGDATPQTHEITLMSSDVFALVSDVARDQALNRLFERMGMALQQQCDLEYAAEELLLSMTSSSLGGNTALLGEVGAFPKSPTEPPQFSQSIS